MLGFCLVVAVSGSAGLIGGVGSGCASGGNGSGAWASGPASGSEGTTIAARGKPRDVSAAISRSLPVVELAVLDERRLEGGGREFVLVGSRGEEGWLRVGYAEGDDKDPAWRRLAVEMRMSARIGRFGHAEKERALVDRVRKELMTLAKQP